ncbi:MAG: type II secretion system F family protein [Methylobacteriaceae bacterium]|nr:type II secretion system F family protein [Methylobacteriaceae bacterium]MBV9246451.1 type II secretion system F family protein [Methylobacteriaceae bacterium]MBV9633231.1 type II secretion system F family protein [Methylobacteriaceae bacterium]MBV9705049.1 type II secretion system F family protein [Methylobacteriaceae bacterium]
MASFRYQAMTAKGELVSGSLDAPSATEVARRIEYLGLVPIDMRPEQAAGTGSSSLAAVWSELTIGRPGAEDITLFSRDLALILSAGARLDDALELLLSDETFGRLKSVIGSVRAAVLSGETFADALAKRGDLFPPMYVSLVRVGEASGTLTAVLDALAEERQRTAALKRKVIDALSYPAFVLCAASAVLVFFIGFVLPQFGSVLRDFGAKLDPIVRTLLGVSDFLRANATEIIVGVAVCLALLWLALRSPSTRRRLIAFFLQLPVIRGFAASYATALFCRNLGVLLGNGVGVTTALRMLVDTMQASGSRAAWEKVAERVRQGGKLAEALAAVKGLSTVAIRMLRLGEETGQLAALALKVADLFEKKLERGLDKFVGVVGPAAILTISVIVGGLIVSIMTSLLSITQLVN